MKKLAILTIAVMGLGYGGVNVASGQQAAVESTPIQSTFRTGNLTSTIDDIEIPHHILEYVQITYDGHAVIKAEKVQRSGQDLYKLRVDRDDRVNDATGISLLFDMNWELVGSEKPAAPPPPTPTAPKIEEAAPAAEDGTNNADEKPVQEIKPEGGSGQAEREEEDVNKPVEETEDRAPVTEESRTTE